MNKSDKHMFPVMKEGYGKISLGPLYHTRGREHDGGSCMRVPYKLLLQNDVCLQAIQS